VRSEGGKKKKKKKKINVDSEGRFNRVLLLASAREKKEREKRGEKGKRKTTEYLLPSLPWFFSSPRPHVGRTESAKKRERMGRGKSEKKKEEGVDYLTYNLFSESP